MILQLYILNKKGVLGTFVFEKIFNEKEIKNIMNLFINIEKNKRKYNNDLLNYLLN